jgi:hypothetical protein
MRSSSAEVSRAPGNCDGQLDIQDAMISLHMQQKNFQAKQSHLRNQDCQMAAFKACLCPALVLKNTAGKTRKNCRVTSLSWCWDW